MALKVSINAVFYRLPWIANKIMICSFTNTNMDHMISELIPIYIVSWNIWIIGAETKEFPNKARSTLNRHWNILLYL